MAEGVRGRRLQERDHRQGRPPKDPDWDAEDVRYSTIRWITSNAADRSVRSDPRAWIRARERSSTPTSCSRRPCSRTTPTASAHRGSGGDGQRASCHRRARRPAPGCRWIGSAWTGDALAEAGRRAAHGPAHGPVDCLPGTRAGRMLETASARAHDARGGAHAGPAPQLPLEHCDARTTSSRTWPGRASTAYASVMEYASPNIDYGPGSNRASSTRAGPALRPWVIRYGYTPSGAERPGRRLRVRARIADESRRPATSTRPTRTRVPPMRLDPRTQHLGPRRRSAAVRQGPHRVPRRHLADPRFEARVVGQLGRASRCCGARWTPRCSATDAPRAWP